MSLAQTVGSYRGGIWNITLNYSGKVKVSDFDTTRILECDSVKLGKKYLKKFQFPDNFYYVFDIPKGLPDGRYMFFYDTAQTRRALKFVVRSKKYEGLFEHFSPSGHLEYSSFYINGLKNGVDISYFSGRLSAITQYRDGEKHGFTFVVFHNSTAARIGYYTSDSTLTIIEDWGLSGDIPYLLRSNEFKFHSQSQK